MNVAAAKMRPIIMSAPMILAILKGRKTQTRRLFKPQPDLVDPKDWDEHLRWAFSETGHGGEGWYFIDSEYPDEGSMFYRCPQGRPGDLLYVKETWQIAGGRWEDADANCTDEIHVIYHADTTFRKIEVPRDQSWGIAIDKKGIRKKKFSPMHMPKWAARIFLEITDVRVQRLQEITEEDAVAEGAVWIDQGRGHNNWKNTNCWFMDTEKAQNPDLGGNGLGSARYAYANFWNYLHGGPNWNLKPEREQPWELNPLVWTISFKRVKGPTS